MFNRKKTKEHPLVKAFETALRDNDLSFSPADVGFELRQEADARALVAVLERIAGLEETQLVLRASTAVSLVRQEIESNVAALVKIILREGVPALLRIEERLRASSLDPGGDVWIQVLRALVITSSVEGGQRLVSAIAAELHSGNPLWCLIFLDLQSGAIQRDQLYQVYTNHLPPDPFLPYFLHLGKAVCLKQSMARHPLDLAEAEIWFETWLHDPTTNEDTAIDAAVSLSLINQPWAAGLRAAALHHPIRQVRLEAAWGLARSGIRQGIDVLVGECHDFRSTLRAQAYLRELGYEHQLPALCQDAEFTIKAEISRWLDQPDSGYNCPPDRVETVWRTDAIWPGLNASVGLYVLAYEVRDPWELLLPGRGFGVGVAGNPPFYIWTRELTTDTHAAYEDIAASGIYVLCKGDKLEEIYWGDELEEYAFLLREWKGAPLVGTQLSRVVVVDPPLAGFPTLVAVVEADLGGLPGWAVIESPSVPGATSYWYQAGLRPEQTSSDDILTEHVGRRLLGWSPRATESHVVRAPSLDPWPPGHFADRYEAMVDQAVKGGEGQRYALFEDVRARIPGGLKDYATAVRELGEPARFSKTARLLIPICDHDETACLLIPHLVSFGDLEAALLLFHDLESRRSQALPRYLEPTLLAEAFYSVGRTAEALEILRDALHQAAQRYQEKSASWGRSEKAHYSADYLTLVALLEQCTGGAAAQSLAAWKRLPSMD